jgi:hypothetical protein
VVSFYGGVECVKGGLLGDLGLVEIGELGC